MPESSAESAVRLYLQWLQDPASVVDQGAVQRAEAEVSRAGDPLAKLHALADLDHARQADGERITADFVSQAKAYADSESIPVSAFQQVGVPADVLVKAGLQAARRGGPRRTSASGGSRQRAPQVSSDQIKAAALSLPKQFTLADVTDRAGGGSPATVRKAVEDLVREGRAARLGPKENHSGRGRAPIVYELR